MFPKPANFNLVLQDITDKLVQVILTCTCQLSPLTILIFLLLLHIMYTITSLCKVLYTHLSRPTLAEYMCFQFTKVPREVGMACFACKPCFCFWKCFKFCVSAYYLVCSFV